MESELCPPFVEDQHHHHSASAEGQLRLPVMWNPSMFGSHAQTVNMFEHLLPTPRHVGCADTGPVRRNFLRLNLDLMSFASPQSVMIKTCPNVSNCQAKARKRSDMFRPLYVESLRPLIWLK
ncbi:hypothetical protein CHS0354_004421, partial [Potamilus streckersoni]